MSKIDVYDYSDKRVVMFDILLTIIVSSIALAGAFKMHKAIAIGISVVLGLILFYIFRTKVGFFIVTIFFSAIWALVSGSIAYLISSEDKTWGIVVGIFAFIFSLGSHGLAKRFYDNVNEV